MRSAEPRPGEPATTCGIANCGLSGAGRLAKSLLLSAVLPSGAAEIALARKFPEPSALPNFGT